jgi:hypothetical protein
MHLPSPATSMMLVFSLPTSMRLTRQRSGKVALSRAIAVSSEIATVPVKIAMSPDIALRYFRLEQISDSRKGRYSMLPIVLIGDLVSHLHWGRLSKCRNI